MNVAIRIVELVKRYASDQPAALKGVSLEVPAGAIFGLLGANGAGKTTLVKSLLGLHCATTGTCEVLGRPPSDAQLRRRIGYLPEQLSIPEYYRAEPFLRHMAGLNGFNPADLRRRIAEVLALVELEGAGRKFVSEYSKGMRQRLGLAQALLHDPELIILDEPTDGLDPLGRKKVRELLTALRARGKTIFLNSHLLSEVELVCDEVVILKAGSIARRGTPRQLTAASGEYRIRLAGDAAAIAQSRAWFSESRVVERELFVTPQDVSDLNHIIDRLRAARLDIEAVEPVRASLEDAFVSIVNERADA